MPTVAYIANQFPSPVEPYVVEEIRELRQRGVEVIACSGRKVDETELSPQLREFAKQTIFLQAVDPWLLLQAVWLCFIRIGTIGDLVERALFSGNEPVLRRLRCLMHTLLGACYALLLKDRGVEHIHAHHGYFASWIAMVAARLLGAGFSMTLHGSDLLLNGAYLDTKLRSCNFCFTVSNYNRQYIVERYLEIDASKIILQRMGVDVPSVLAPPPGVCRRPTDLLLLAVGRLHAVKDHAFLIRACALLKQRKVSFSCLLAGEGPERKSLERLIAQLGLESEVRLLGHVPREQLEDYYRLADIVVLTSRSEGVPLVLMEAMAHGRIVLVPAITGISELVIDGKTGFLFRAGSLDDFVHRVECIQNWIGQAEDLRGSAREHVLTHFNRNKNLKIFGDLFLQKIASPQGCVSDEDPLLQQI